MDLLTIFRTAWRSLTVNKMRSVLTALGIIIGVASVIMMVSLSQGATAGITQRISSMGTNIIQISPSGGRAVGGAGVLRLEDAQALVQLPYVKNVAPSIDSNVTAAVGSVTWNATVSGTTPEMENIKAWQITAGGFFTQEDVDNMSMVAVIGRTVADNLFPGAEVPIGTGVRINGLSFTIIGVLPLQGGGGMGGDSDNTIYIPLTTAQQRLVGGQNLRQIIVQASEQDALSFVQSAVTSVLRERHRLAASADNDFRIMDMAQLLATVEDTTRILTLLLGGIAAVSLIVGGIGVMNIMLVSVTERTREIGIRMAVGATTRDILNQFMIEAILLCIIGGALGTTLGYGLSSLFGSLSGWNMQVSPWAAVIAIGFSSVIGVVFGFYPARKAAEADPIEALRYE
ncbi:MAG: multidrug ABC transporter substrate-binding protein [Firmicutes bacterium HGW-Firmicutes-15]|nr:MAG: multidrug ABC transporter substrate-binding protein [Firmicutes bacterium HGW-Firmicutes-15]